MEERLTDICKYLVTLLSLILHNESTRTTCPSTNAADPAAGFPPYVASKHNFYGQLVMLWILTILLAKTYLSIPL